jgi:putative tricarboxylic transport membrane protein
MNSHMFDMALSALDQIFDPTRLMFLVLGTMMGLIVGAIPGVGGLVGLTLLLPFTFGMDPYSAIAVMMGLLAVTTTSDTIPAVLFGVPGTVGSAATILDGYPLARQGQAGRALGAGFMASMLGGLFGAILLGFSMPVLKPLVLGVGSPELLAICVFGLSLVAVLSGGAVLKGLGAACIGLLVATTGDDPQTSQLRWTFGTLYLYDGLPIVPLALGMFAMPELADLAISRKTIADEAKKENMQGQWEGVKDVFSHKFLVLRCALIGSGLGSIPGIGASVIDWIAYGHAARTEKGAADTFGSGDIRGVIASESSNNAKEGGSLVPTIAFGVPGSASMALLLSAFLLLDIPPGEEMLTTKLDLSYTLVWSVAIANIIGAGVCLMGAHHLAKISVIRIGILVPIVLSVVFIGVYQASRVWGDFAAMFIFGLLGWLMKRFGWPRPPLVLGFVLGGLIENYLFISVERYEWAWLGRWPVMIILGLTLYGVLGPVIKRFVGSSGKKDVKLTANFRSPRIIPASYFSVAIIFIFAVFFYRAGEFEFGAQLVPRIVTGFGMLFIAAELFGQMFFTEEKLGGGPVKKAQIFDFAESFDHLTSKEIVQRALAYAAWALSVVGIGYVIGLLPAVLVFLLSYMRFHGKESWRIVLTISICVWLFYLLLFQVVLDVHWPHSWVGLQFPTLRSKFEIF